MHVTACPFRSREEESSARRVTSAVVRVRYHRSSNSAYISLREVEGDEPVERQNVFQTHTGSLIVLDFDEKHRLVGLEIHDAKNALPTDVLRRAD